LVFSLMWYPSIEHESLQIKANNNGILIDTKIFRKRRTYSASLVSKIAKNLSLNKFLVFQAPLSLVYNRYLPEEHRFMNMLFQSYAKFKTKFTDRFDKREKFLSNGYDKASRLKIFETCTWSMQRNSVWEQNKI